jgi:glucose dehydrogenase
VGTLPALGWVSACLIHPRKLAPILARPGGKHFLVIAAGGHPKVTEEKQSDEIIAFTLP